MAEPVDIDDEEDQLDVALQPGPNADTPVEVARYISQDVRDLYDVYSYRHGAAILATSYPEQLAEIQSALIQFRLTTVEIGTPGGNESEIPKKFSRLLRPGNWVESRIQGDLVVRTEQYTETFTADGRSRKERMPDATPTTISNFIDGHKIDYVKGRVAFDLEWNSKDQTFDRDLYALRAFHDCGLISVGVLVTRSASLNPVFEVVPQRNRAGEIERHTTGRHAGEIKNVRAKYGASTTWMGKLLYRLNAGRHGGCPVLIFGITPQLISDWPPQQ